MLDGLIGRTNFKTKCKSALSRTKNRIEIIKRKRNGMQKFLKKDIADHLKNNLHRNAYSRAEGLYMELNLSSCYHYVEECCTCISHHLKDMHKDSECLEDCKVAVASLIYAAARFADLPELCDLRTEFYDKYGKALDPFVDKEFAEKFKSIPPTMEMKLKLMLDIARELSVSWDPEPLRQQLQCPPMLTYGVGDDHKFNRTITDGVQVKVKNTDRDKEMNSEQTIMSGFKLRYSQSCCTISDTLQEQHNKQEHEIPMSSSTSDSDKDGVFTEDEDFVLRSKEAKTKKFVKVNKTDEDLVSKPMPRPNSVRTKFLKQSLTTVSDFEHEPVIKETASAGAESQSVSLRTQSSIGSCNSTDQPVSELPLPPGRRRYFFPESQPATIRKEVEGNIKSELPILLTSM